MKRTQTARDVFELRDQRIWPGSQTLNGSLIVQDITQGGSLYRATVKWDSSCPSQSHSEVTAWTRDGWELVQCVPTQELQIAAFSYVQQPAKWDAAMRDSLRVLVELGRKVLTGLDPVQS